jgi:hypothetical protein
MPLDFSRQDDGDDSDSEHVVVYPFFRDTLLGLVRADPEFPPEELVKVLRSVGEGLRVMHERGWIHLGMCLCCVEFGWGWGGGC